MIKSLFFLKHDELRNFIWERGGATLLTEHSDQVKHHTGTYLLTYTISQHMFIIKAGQRPGHILHPFIVFTVFMNANLQIDEVLGCNKRKVTICREF